MPRRLRVRELAVWANGLRVGSWRWPSRGGFEFLYDEAWIAAPEARPLSLSLPLTLDRIPHRGDIVAAYFDNLLPDSEVIRRRLQDRYLAQSRGPFDLLAALGRDCVGAVQILPYDEKPTDPRIIDALPLNEAAIATELAGVTSPAAAGIDSNFRISIAGAQEKTAFLRHHGRWCRPAGSTPTTHIFKLPLGLVGNRQADMTTSVENEWLCARIAAAFGIPVATCAIERFGSHKVLAVERFDRQLHSSGKYWLRLMQEDFCQATGTPYVRKYQADGGPGLAEITRVLQGSADSRRDLDILFRSQLLFWMLAATDGHAKNFSIRLMPGSRFQLTPLYDVLSAWPVIGRRSNEIPVEKVKLAMALPGERPRYLLQTIRRRHFLALGRRLGLGERSSQVIDEMHAQTSGVIDAVQRDLPRGFPQPLLERICAGLMRQSKKLAETN
jgi:serine/threonine-protein kinase HipA